MATPAGTRAEVRTAIEAFFNARIADATIPTLGTVYGFPEKIMDEADMFANVQPGIQDGAFLFIHLMHSSDLLIALGGPSDGRKWVEYECTLSLVFRSLKPSAIDAGEDNETMLDAIVASIRKYRTCGTTDGTIFQWGLGSRNGGTDIEVESFYPQDLHASKSATQILTLIKLKVAQEIQA